MNVPMATGGQSPVWPLPDVTRKRWTFGASRAKGARQHAGVDLYAPRGSVVLAPEAGIVIASQRFNGPNAHALLIQLNSGPVVLLGEVEPDSWRMFNADPGARVAAGQPVARVGINPGGDQMLHLEMYVSGTRRNHRWPTGRPPSALLNPTEYLKRASVLDADQSDDQGDDSDDSGEVDDDDTNDDIAQNDTIPADPNGGGGGAGAVIGLGLIFLVANAMESRR